MGLLGAAKNIDFLVGFLKIEKTSKYTDFNPVLIVNLYNSNPVKISDHLLHMQGGAMAHLRTPFEYAEKAL